ncbi:MAG: hypothetical protein KJN79_03520 [Gammaproteobacteria bacterium]|nr:hypothetical protein [Gammaproteobacteria bacterium]
MSNLIKQGCRAAELYHRYDEIHEVLFGVSYIRQLTDRLRRRQRPGNAENSHSLQELESELDALQNEIRDPESNTPVTGADRELRKALLEYTGYLGKAVSSLAHICRNLDQDEPSYRALRDDGRSAFTADKLAYDQVLSELERLGTRLDRLFSNY